MHLMSAHYGQAMSQVLSDPFMCVSVRVLARTRGALKLSNLKSNFFLKKKQFIKLGIGFSKVIKGQFSTMDSMKRKIFPLLARAQWVEVVWWTSDQKTEGKRQHNVRCECRDNSSIFFLQCVWGVDMFLLVILAGRAIYKTRLTLNSDAMSVVQKDKMEGFKRHLKTLIRI